MPASTPRRQTREWAATCHPLRASIESPPWLDASLGLTVSRRRGVSGSVSGEAPFQSQVECFSGWGGGEGHSGKGSAFAAAQAPRGCALELLGWALTRSREAQWDREASGRPGQVPEAQVSS